MEQKTIISKVHLTSFLRHSRDVPEIQVYVRYINTHLIWLSMVIILIGVKTDYNSINDNDRFSCQRLLLQIWKFMLTIYFKIIINIYDVSVPEECLSFRPRKLNSILTLWIGTWRHPKASKCVSCFCSSIYSNLFKFIILYT